MRSVAANSVDFSRQDSGPQPPALQHIFDTPPAKSAAHEKQQASWTDSTHKGIPNGTYSEPSVRRVSAAAAGVDAQQDEIAEVLNSLRRLTLGHSKAHHHRLMRPWAERQLSQHSSQDLGKARLDLSMLTVQAQPSSTRRNSQVQHDMSQAAGPRRGLDLAIGSMGPEVTAESQSRGGGLVLPGAETNANGGRRDFLTVLHF